MQIVNKALVVIASSRGLVHPQDPPAPALLHARRKVKHWEDHRDKSISSSPAVLYHRAIQDSKRCALRYHLGAHDPAFASIIGSPQADAQGREFDCEVNFFIASDHSVIVFQLRGQQKSTEPNKKPVLVFVLLSSDRFSSRRSSRLAYFSPSPPLKAWTSVPSRSQS
jgi:hypothetical protein